MFDKIVVVEPINILPYAKDKLFSLAKKVVFYDDLPKNDEEMLSRISDADAILISYISVLSGEVIKKSSNLKYIGMCCSLYPEQGSNVDVKVAKEMNIVVTGVNDYGDEGVGEFVVSELVQLLHGFNGRMWDDESREITGLKVGIIGMGATGQSVAKALGFFGADLHYYSRSRKLEVENSGVKYSELNNLLEECEVICTCLNKGVVLLHEKEFEVMGHHKILINTGGSPTFDILPFEHFIQNDKNYFLCDMPSSLPDKKFLAYENVRYVGAPSGLTKQAKVRLSEKVISNLETNIKN